MLFLSTNVSIFVLSTLINRNKNHIMSQLQFEHHFNNNYDALSSFAMKLAKNRMDADDLIQDTAIKAYRNFNRFVEGSNFKNWSFTILKNTFISKYRKRKSMNLVSLPVEEMEFAIASEDLAIEKKGPSMDSISSSIEALSEKSRKPFVMFLNGYQYKEISEALEIPVGTVKSRINFARKKLKQKFLSNKSSK